MTSSRISRISLDYFAASESLIWEFVHVSHLDRHSFYLSCAHQIDVFICLKWSGSHLALTKYDNRIRNWSDLARPSPLTT